MYTAWDLAYIESINAEQQAMKIKWTVQEAPTGPYRTFVNRGWPMGHINGKTAFHIVCKDKYVPSKVKTGDHGELSIRVADWRKEGTGFDWKGLVKKGATLSEAKEIAQKFADAHPEFFA